jgi:uncharacterized membrane protein YdjX (TVP38/TMEM64 family)
MGRGMRAFLLEHHPMPMHRSHLPPLLKTTLKLLVGISLTILAIKLFQAFDLPALLQQGLTWVQGLGPWGPIGFIALYNLATVLFLPGSLLTLGGGLLFGLGWGSVYVFCAATLGATFAFLLGRYLARDWVTRRIAGNAKFQAIDQAIAKEGLKIVFLTRLSPLFPFNLLNYALGLTQVSLKDYVLGSCGMLPGTILYVYLGSLAGNLASLGSPTQSTPQAQQFQWAIRIIGFLATLAVTVYITRIAKRSLDESIEGNR